MGDFFVVKVMSGGQSASVVSAMSNEIALLQYPPAAASAVVLLIIVDADGRGDPAPGRRAQRARGIGPMQHAATHIGKRPWTFYALAAFFALFVLFLYGPMSAIYILSFQGPTGGLTFPMNGVSLHWFGALFGQQRTGDFAGAVHALDPARRAGPGV